MKKMIKALVYMLKLLKDAVCGYFNLWKASILEEKGEPTLPLIILAFILSTALVGILFIGLIALTAEKPIVGLTMIGIVLGLSMVACYWIQDSDNKDDD